jgi:hypothetical protein
VHSVGHGLVYMTMQIAKAEDIYCLPYENT